MTKSLHTVSAVDKFCSCASFIKAPGPVPVLITGYLIARKPTRDAVPAQLSQTRISPFATICPSVLLSVRACQGTRTRQDRESLSPLGTTRTQFPAEARGPSFRAESAEPRNPGKCSLESNAWNVEEGLRPALRRWLGWEEFTTLRLSGQLRATAVVIHISRCLSAHRFPGFLGSADSARNDGPAHWNSARMYELKG